MEFFLIGLRTAVNVYSEHQSDTEEQSAGGGTAGAEERKRYADYRHLADVHTDVDKGLGHQGGEHTDA